MRRAAILLALPTLILAGCDRDKPQAVPTRPQPVLEGSVSDAMLQPDELRAPAPLAEPVASGAPEAALGLDEPADNRPGRKPRPRPTDDATAATSASPSDTATAGAADKNERPAPKATRSASPTPSPTPQASPSPRPTRSPRPSPTPSPKAAAT